MNQLPINKIFLAGFAFTLAHWQKILQISILPLLVSAPFLFIVPELLESMEKVFSGGELIDVALPDNMMIYFILFLYGYLNLSLNMYRLVMLGEQSVSGLMPILSLNQIGRFMGLTLLVGLVTTVPLLITGVVILQLVAYFLIIPITLNFVNIALGQPSKYKWHLPFTTQANLFFLQAVLPTLVTILFGALFEFIGLSAVFLWVIKLLLFYWTLTTLALCYQLIVKNQTS